MKKPKLTLAKLASRMTPYSAEAIQNMYAIAGGEGIPTILASHEALRNMLIRRETEIESTLGKLLNAMDKVQHHTQSELSAFYEEVAAIVRGIPHA